MATATWAKIALGRCERAIGLHPQIASTYRRGANALAHLGERGRARSWAACAITMDPHDIACLYNVVSTYAVLGDVDDALNILETVVHRSSAMTEQLLSFAHSGGCSQAVR